MRYVHLVAALAVALGAGQARPAHAQTTEQSLYVSVSDREGAPVTDLTPDAFLVREDGRTREVLRVSQATDPIDIALLVDNSQAASPHISDLRNALRAFVTRMAGHGHAVAVIGLADRPTILQDYTSNATLLERGVDRVFAQPGSGMRLLDALIETGRGLERRESPRRVLVTVTTEGPEFSNPNHTRVIEALRDSRAALFALVLTRGAGPDMSDEARSRGIVFDEGSRVTGGRQQQLLSSMALRDALDRLARELEHQQHVVYARPGALIPPDRIEVSSTRPELTARGTPAATRPGAAGGAR